jgi:hypothetical protein
LNVNGSVLIKVRFDSLCLDIEIELLCLVGVDLILDNKVSSTNHGESSVEWELGDEEEWLANLHTEILVVTLGLLGLHL